MFQIYESILKCVLLQKKVYILILFKYILLFSNEMLQKVTVECLIALTDCVRYQNQVQSDISKNSMYNYCNLNSLLVKWYCWMELKVKKIMSTTIT